MNEREIDLILKTLKGQKLDSVRAFRGEYNDNDSISLFFEKGSINIEIPRGHSVSDIDIQINNGEGWIY